MTEEQRIAALKSSTIGIPGSSFSFSSIDFPHSAETNINSPIINNSKIEPETLKANADAYLTDVVKDVALERSFDVLKNTNIDAVTINPQAAYNQYKETLQTTSHGRTTGGGGINSIDEMTLDKNGKWVGARTSGGGGINSVEGWILDKNGKWIEDHRRTTGGGAGGRYSSFENRVWVENNDIKGNVSSDLDLSFSPIDEIIAEKNTITADIESSSISSPIETKHLLALALKKQKATLDILKKASTFTFNSNSESTTINPVVGLHKDNEYLSNLISNSEDAFTNMFDVSIIFAGVEDDNIPKCRITNFTAPQWSVKTEEIPFMNVTVRKILAGHNLEHQQTFNIRVDEDYRVWTILKSKMCIDENGQFNIYDLDGKECTIIVQTYKFESDPVPKPTRKWTFYDCYVTNLVEITYNYSGSQGVAGNVSFMYSHYTEESL